MKSETILTELSAAGLVADPTPSTITKNAFSRVLNVDFADNSVRSSKGYKKIDEYPNEHEPLFALGYYTDEVYYWVFFDKEKAYSYDSRNWFELTDATNKFTGTTRDRFSGLVAGNVLTVTNGVDAPKYWNRLGAVAPPEIPDVPPDQGPGGDDGDGGGAGGGDADEGDGVDTPGSGGGGGPNYKCTWVAPAPHPPEDSDCYREAHGLSPLYGNAPYVAGSAAEAAANAAPPVASGSGSSSGGTSTSQAPGAAKWNNLEYTGPSTSDWIFNHNAATAYINIIGVMKTVQMSFNYWDRASDSNKLWDGIGNFQTDFLSKLPSSALTQWRRFKISAANFIKYNGGNWRGTQSINVRGTSVSFPGSRTANWDFRDIQDGKPNTQWGVLAYHQVPNGPTWLQVPKGLSYAGWWYDPGTRGAPGATSIPGGAAPASSRGSAGNPIQPIGTGEERGTGVRTSPGTGLEDLIWDSRTSTRITWADKNVTCKSIRSFKGFFIALGITENGISYENRVMWSDPTENNHIPITWDYTDPTTLAGFLDLDDTEGHIIDGIVYGDQFLVFKDSSIYSLTHTTGAYVMIPRRLSRGVGLLALNCAISVKNLVYFISNDDVMITNGTTVTSIANEKVRNFLFKQINSDTYAMSYVVHNNEDSEIWFCVPTADSKYPNAAAVFEYKTNTWTMKQVPSASSINSGYIAEQQLAWADADTEWDNTNIPWGQRSFNTFEKRMIGTVPGIPKGMTFFEKNTHPFFERYSVELQNELETAPHRICMFNEGYSFEGHKKLSLVERTDLLPDEYSGSRSFLITRALPQVSGEGVVKIQFGSQEEEGGPVKWKQPIDFDVNNQRAINPRLSGFYFAYRIYGEGVNRWFYSGMNIEVMSKGTRRRSFLKDAVRFHHTPSRVPALQPAPQQTPPPLVVPGIPPRISNLTPLRNVTVALTNDTGVPNDNITRDGLLTIGNREPGTIVQYSTDNGITWVGSFTPKAGVNRLLVKQSNATSESGTTPFTFTLDNTNPAPTVTLHDDTGVSATDHITKDGTLDVVGAKTGERFEYSIDGGTNWTSSFTAVLGINDVLVHEIDKQGNISPASHINFTLLGAIPAPTVTLRNDTGTPGDKITSDGTLNVVGSNNTDRFEYSTNGGRTWYGIFTPRKGVNNVLVREIDIAGNISPNATITFTVGLPTLTVALQNDTGRSATDLITRDGTLNITGLTAGNTIEYSIDGGTNWTTGFTPVEGQNRVCVRQVEAGGAASPKSNELVFTLDTQILPVTVTLLNDTGTPGDNITQNGVFTIGNRETGSSIQYSIDGGANWTSSFVPVKGMNDFLIRQTDVAGNESIPTRFTFTLDNENPAPTVTLQTDSGGSWGNATDHITNDGTLNVVGAEAGERFEYSIDGGTNWTSTFTAVEGRNDVLVHEIDTAGNISPAAAIHFTLDTIAPVVTMTDYSGSDTTPDITGTVDDPNAIVVVTIEGTNYTATNNGDGTWSLTIPTALAEGAHNATVITTNLGGFPIPDVAGNVAFATGTVTITAVADPCVPFPEHGEWRDYALAHGATDARLDRVCEGGDFRDWWNGCKSTQTFPLTDFASAYVYADTEYNFIDAWRGCILDSQSVENILNSLDKVDKDADFGLIITHRDAILAGVPFGPSRHTPMPPITTIGVCHLPLSAAAQALKAKLEAKGWIITIEENCAPVLIPSPTVTLQNDTGTAGDKITSDGTLNVVGSKAGAIFEYSVDGGAHWTSTFTAAEGSNDVKVREVDGTNKSPPTDFTFTLNTTDPVVTMTDYSGTDTTPDITGTIDDNTATVVVTIEGTDYTATNNGDGTWYLTVGRSIRRGSSSGFVIPTLVVGAHNATIVATDAAGNVGNATGTVTITAIVPCAMPAGEWRDCAKANGKSDADLNDICNKTSIFQWWQNCKSTQTFPLVDVSKSTNFFNTWNGCSGLTTFPVLDMAKGTFFKDTWKGCNLNRQSVLNILNSLDKVPFAQLIDHTTNIGTDGHTLTSAENSLLTKLRAKGWVITIPKGPCAMPVGDWRTWSRMRGISAFHLNNICKQAELMNWWFDCKSTQPFPLVDTSSITNFYSTWDGCSGLTTFPLLDVSNGTNFDSAWQNCSGLTSFPLLDVSSGTNFYEAWVGCKLDSQSVENVLNSLDKVPFAQLTNPYTAIGTDGHTLSVRENQLLTKLRAKGWRITIT